MEKVAFVKGGSWLLGDTDPESVFVPEELNEDHRAFAKTTYDFVTNEVLPVRDKLERKDYALACSLLKRAGELGLCMVDVPQKYDGLGADKLTSMLVTDALGRAGSFSVTHGAHVGIGSLPIVFFGTEAQKRKYLPKLATAEKVAAYALTEPSSGSDALGARCRAALSEDGTHYVLNGTKQFITNAGFADVFVVFAKVAGEKFTGFIVERGFPGVRVGAEEDKMGIVGSSTCQLILEDARVPAENVLGEIGKGHKIAFGILNLGRLKLGVGTTGGARSLIPMTVDYVAQRTQFGTPLARFPLIQKKIAEQTIRVYASEAMSYRLAGAVAAYESRLHEAHPEDDAALLAALDEYSVECALSKFYGSETLDFVADEAVQAHGGYGYVKEYPVESAYRDSRINRIFEGTNEINRMLAPGQLLKKAMKGDIPLLEAAAGVQAELAAPETIPAEIGPGPVGREARDLRLAKRAALFLLSEAVSKYAMGIDKEQEALALLADVLAEVYTLDSVVARVAKALDRDGPAKAEVPVKILRVFANESVRRLAAWGEELLATLHAGAEYEEAMRRLALCLRPAPLNTAALKREIAEDALEAGGYRFFIY